MRVSRQGGRCGRGRSPRGTPTFDTTIPEAPSTASTVHVDAAWPDGRSAAGNADNTSTWPVVSVMYGRRPIATVTAWNASSPSVLPKSPPPATPGTSLFATDSVPAPPAMAAVLPDAGGGRHSRELALRTSAGNVRVHPAASTMRHHADGLNLLGGAAVTSTATGASTGMEAGWTDAICGPGGPGGFSKHRVPVQVGSPPQAGLSAIEPAARDGGEGGDGGERGWVEDCAGVGRRLRGEGSSVTIPPSQQESTAVQHCRCRVQRVKAKAKVKAKSAAEPRPATRIITDQKKNALRQQIGPACARGQQQCCSAGTR